MTDSDNRFLAVVAAAHAVAETRFGPPYELVAIVDDVQWPLPEQPLTWRSEQEATELLIRLGVGYAAVSRREDADEATILRLTADALRGAVEVLEEMDGSRPSAEEAASRAREAAEAFLNEPANARAIELAEEQLLARGAMDMHEVDFLVEAADGDDEALENLERYRACFSKVRVPWPDQT